MLTRENIRGADDLPREKVMVPEWAPSGTDPADAYVWAASFWGDDRDAFEMEVEARRGTDGEVNRIGFRAYLVALATVDDDGKKLFTLDDIEWLGRKNAAALDRIYSAIIRLNKLSKADVEELTKNSETGQGAGSGSA
jgi:hypothetical protein